MIYNWKQDGVLKNKQAVTKKEAKVIIMKNKVGHHKLVVEGDVVVEVEKAVEVEKEKAAEVEKAVEVEKDEAAEERDNVEAEVAEVAHVEVPVEKKFAWREDAKKP